MAAPGIGVGDLISACAFIYRQCIKYKDAPKEFDEIAEKAKSTAVVLERTDTEAKISGNLVERAGPQAYEQLADNLRSLRRDSEKLDALVRKYNKIHDEGPGRRLLFALKESSDLTDLRRRIGWHEQTLQLWYMTLVYGSLRRLEGGNEDILKAIEAIKDWSPHKVRQVRRSLYEGDARPLEKELRKSGVHANSEVSVNAAEFVLADTTEQIVIESRARRSTLSESRPSRFNDFGEFDRYPPPRDFSTKTDEWPEIRRTRSTSHRHRPDYIVIGGGHRERDVPPRSPHKHDDYDKDDVVILPSPSRQDRRSSDESKSGLRSPLLVVPDTGPRYRSYSAHGPEKNRPPRSPDRRGRQDAKEQIIVIQAPDDKQKRSSSQRSNKSDRHRRDSSTHSYHRVRRSSANGDGDAKEKIRLVTKMDRIDSIPVGKDE